ncbi:MAG: LysM peptidoglycan-binding domain-containing protein [Pedosphaera sp.]|nr:LysM peptidoglycan-binding domain-containing protein [Pedosphaera sp.]
MQLMLRICPLLRRLTGLALVGVFTTAFAARGENQAYVVKRNDTLYAIARRFEISPGQLAARNGLSRETQVYVGQNLIVPVKSAAPAPPPPPAARAEFTSALQRAVDRASVSPGRWKFIVIHHSGVGEGNLKSTDRYHREERHMEHGLAYHFLIGNGNGMGDGEVAVGNRWKEQLDGGHLRSEEQNKIALGICLVGNFDEKKPTEKQLRSLETLIRSLMKRCNLTASAVKTHQQINIVRTECPGKKFPTSSFLAKLKRSGS